MEYSIDTQHRKSVELRFSSGDIISIDLDQIASITVRVKDDTETTNPRRFKHYYFRISLKNGAVHRFVIRDQIGYFLSTYLVVGNFVDDHKSSNEEENRRIREAEKKRLEGLLSGYHRQPARHGTFPLPED